MLSDAEQRRLSEIERELQADDPRFVARCSGMAARHPARWGGMTARMWLVTAALTMGLAVLMTDAYLVLISLSVAGVSLGLWLSDHPGPRTGGVS
ncbi:DUF3040 domain-containing protein [Couchioplanes caeruleus]|uniref:DUF3040 domain-containing protein n=1 Tax=Couchioplanes caeruleus TaxID=56438 RepID=UPI0020BEC45B|nr:DUF3040 domain-containing protein [Couchioplanes caeruleus]UQU62249.1 DUF3040 domain-containing protein [Couchioplanes caeruleus]